MTVEELINELRLYPKNTPVSFAGSDDAPSVRYLEDMHGNPVLVLGHPCPGCEDPNDAHYTVTLPGIRATIVAGQPVGVIERCDMCGIYDSDDEAAAALYRFLFPDQDD